MSDDEWVWPGRVWKADSRLRWACVIWTLHDEGPFTNKSGQAITKLLRALQRRSSHPPVDWTIVALRQQIPRMIEQAPLLLDRRGNASSTHYLALGRINAMPPNPYIDDSGAPPGERVELVPAEGNGQGAMSAADALAATASFLESAMALAGVTHVEADADSRLADALEENRRLHEQADTLAAQLLDQRRKNEVLERALARRKGTNR
jgi:hypothetical protein